MKRLTGPGLGFGNFWTARRTLAGYETMAMIRKGQVQNISGSDIRAQAEFVASLFGVAAWKTDRPRCSRPIVKRCNRTALARRRHCDAQTVQRTGGICNEMGSNLGIAGGR